MVIASADFVAFVHNVHSPELLCVSGWGDFRYDEAAEDSERGG